MIGKFSKAFKQLPAHNQKRFLFMVVLMVVVVGTVYWIFSGGDDQDNATANDEGLPAERVQAKQASTPGRGEGQIEITEQYLKEKEQEEKQRQQVAKQEGESFMPSVRLDLEPVETAQLEDPPEIPERILTSPSKANPEKGECDTPEGIGIKLDNGRCMLKSGNIYDENGSLVVDRTGKDNKKQRRQIARDEKERQEQWLSLISGELDEIDKARDDKIKSSGKGHKSKKLKKEAKDDSQTTKLPLGLRQQAKGEGVIVKTNAPAPQTQTVKTSTDGFRGFKPGNMLVGILDTEINSDAPSQIRVRVVMGTLKDAILVGGIKREGDRVVANMKYLTYKDKFATVNAVLVDPATNITSLQGDVNYHVISRFGWSLLYGLSVGAKDLVLTEGTTTIQNQQSVVTRPPSDAERIGKAGLGYAAEALQDPLKSQINRPPTVHVQMGEMVGIMFAEPVVIDWLPVQVMKEASSL